MYFMILQKREEIKMNKKIRKIISIMLTAVCLLCIPYSKVLAADEIQTVDEKIVTLDARITDNPFGNVSPEISTYATTFNKASIVVSFSSEGMMVDIYTLMNKEASVVGVKDIKIQKKVWYGWSTVVTSEGGGSTNCLSSGCTVIYRGAELGETYRVLCTHYGNTDGGYRELENETSGYVYTY